MGTKNQRSHFISRNVIGRGGYVRCKSNPRPALQTALWIRASAFLGGECSIQLSYGCIHVLTLVRACELLALRRRSLYPAELRVQEITASPETYTIIGETGEKVNRFGKVGKKV